MLDNHVIFFLMFFVRKIKYKMLSFFFLRNCLIAGQICEYFSDNLSAASFVKPMNCSQSMNRSCFLTRKFTEE